MLFAILFMQMFKEKDYVIIHQKQPEHYINPFVNMIFQIIL